MMWWYDDGGWGLGWGGWLVMSLVMVMFVGLVVWLAVGMRNGSFRGDAGRPDPTDRAEETLAQRFARGEIDQEELVRSRELLRGGRR